MENRQKGQFMANEKETGQAGSLAQQYAVAIERAMCTALSCDRGGLDGVANSDYIRKQPFEAIEEALRYRFPDCRSDVKRKPADFSVSLIALRGRP